MLALALPFLTRNWKLLAAIFLISTAYLYARHQGASGERKAEAARVVKAQAHVVKREAVATAISDTAKAQLTQERVQIQYRTRTLIEKVPIYVSPSADAACVVNRGFVLQHDLAASGASPSLPGPPGGPLDAPSGVPLSTVLATVEGNYGAAYDWRSEALTWRDWYTKQLTAWNKR